LLSEKDVVILVAFEGWVEIDEVYGFVFDMKMEDFEIITVV